MELKIKSIIQKELKSNDFRLNNANFELLKVDNLDLKRKLQQFTQFSFSKLNNQNKGEKTFSYYN